MKLGSLFDGSGGFPLAGSLCGIEPVWASEVEPYPIAVTRSRFPQMRHLGSVTDIHGGEIEPVDVITFGSPCQDLSVAGKRAGLKHEANGDEETTRSGLFMEAVRIIKEMRKATHGRYPTFALWENVPGAFSSNKGEDFRTVLEELIKIVEPGAVMPPVPAGGWPYADSYCGDGWSIAYRVLDAQYWGVPQRRRRIYLVLDLRGQRAGKVSFEREGLRGYFAEGRTPWKAAAGDAASGVGADDLTGNRIVPYTLKIRSGCEGGGKGAPIQTDKSATLSTLNDQYLFQPVDMVPDDRCSVNGTGINGDIAATLDASYYKGCGMRQGIEREVVFVPCLNCNHDQPIIASVDCRNFTENSKVNGTLQAKSTEGRSLNLNNVVRIRYIVRRLTPTECARLQGFPDDWGHQDRKEDFTDEEYRFWLGVRNTHAAINGKTVKDYKKEQMVAWYNKLHTDSAEYKMWGNGIALPTALYVMQGISDALRKEETYEL